MTSSATKSRSIPVMRSACAKKLRSALSDYARKGKHRQNLARLNDQQIAAIHADWQIWARDDQLPPTHHAPREHAWHVWLLLGGRGAGKTRAGAEWIKAQALGIEPLTRGTRNAYRAGWRNNGRCTRRHGRRVFQAYAGWCIEITSARTSSPRKCNSPGRMERWHRCSQPRTQKACAVRNSRWPGAMKSPSGVTERRLGTCFSSDCGWASHPHVVATTTPRPGLAAEAALER